MNMASYHTSSLAHTPASVMVISPSRICEIPEQTPANIQFSDLPGELHNKIYSHLIALLPRTIDVAVARANSRIVLEKHGVPPIPHAPFPLLSGLPGMVYVSRRVYREFVPLLVRSISFHLFSSPDIRYLSRFLFSKSLPWTSPLFCHIRHLEFPTYTTRADAPCLIAHYMQFARLCISLHSITLSFSTLDLLKSHFPNPVIRNGPRRSKTVQEVAAAYELATLHLLPKLTRVSMRCYANHLSNPPSVLDDPLQTFWDVGDWLVQGWRGVRGVRGVVPHTVGLVDGSLAAFQLVVQRG
ncbi:hypothetical protein BDV95DRAFT_621715 [Massariosphaeria phaeospora]|uniref:F-box domain-containing protein n=1 Tax=Massariosphaeria phaeospora TaxID=100035 RepID=A0A7C8I1E4_9PLEO|nr:hypothetical protein BDV95DRAFT_621715 [Massariosphaeria phaeospora]